MTVYRKNRTRVARPYREAFPALGIEEVVANVRLGRAVVEYTNELNVIVGHVRVISVDDTMLVFEQRFLGAVNVGTAEGTMRVELSNRQVASYTKPVMICPKCRNSVQDILLVAGEWACRACHDLCYLAQRLTPDQRLVVERERLAVALERGEHAADRNARRRARRRLAAIEEQLGDEPGDLPQQLRYRVSARWLEPGEHPKTEITSEDIHYNWKPTQPRGFRALRASEEIDTADPGASD